MYDTIALEIVWTSTLTIWKLSVAKSVVLPMIKGMHAISLLVSECHFGTFHVVLLLNDEEVYINV